MWLVLALILFLIGGYALKKPSSPSPVAVPNETISPLPPPPNEADKGGDVPMLNIPAPRPNDGMMGEPPRFPENSEDNSGFPGAAENYSPPPLDFPEGQEMVPPPPPPPPPSPEFFEGGAIEPPQYFDGEQEIPPAFEPPPPLEDDEAFIPPPLPLDPQEEPELVDR